VTGMKSCSGLPYVEHRKLFESDLMCLTTASAAVRMSAIAANSEEICSHWKAGAVVHGPQLQPIDPLGA
jgi:hypothetical protein